jgi:hypothetical protein
MFLLFSSILVKKFSRKYENFRINPMQRNSNITIYYSYVFLILPKCNVMQKMIPHAPCMRYHCLISWDFSFLQNEISWNFAKIIQFSHFRKIEKCILVSTLVIADYRNNRVLSAHNDISHTVCSCTLYKTPCSGGKLRVIKNIKKENKYFVTLVQRDI